MTSARPRRGQWQSPAKVNLCLRVIGRRPDGYHLLDSIFVPVDLYDDVIVTVRDDAPERRSRVEVHVDDARVPADASNLAARAAQLVLDTGRVDAVVSIELRKRIPPGAGLGGGSSNAATVLCGLNALLRLGLSAQTLARLALQLGADVPFFLSAVPARVGGVGERVEPLSAWPASPLVVVVPPTSVSTTWAFARYRELDLPATSAAATEAARMVREGVLAPELLVNDLERVVRPAFPVVDDLKARLLAAGASAAVMSGSGAAVVGLAPSTAAASGIAMALRTELAVAVPGCVVHAAAVVGPGGVTPPGPAGVG